MIYYETSFESLFHYGIVAVTELEDAFWLCSTHNLFFFLFQHKQTTNMDTNYTEQLAW